MLNIQHIKTKEYVEHIGNGKRQITIASSKFINALELYIEQKISLKQLLRVNENIFIESIHPLKETIIVKTGKNRKSRAGFLKTIFNYASSIKGSGWEQKLSPYSVRTTFFIVTVLSQIDDFIRKLSSFINREIDELESMIQAFDF